jgi:hypothetical protein
VRARRDGIADHLGDRRLAVADLRHHLDTHVSPCGSWRHIAAQLDDARRSMEINIAAGYWDRNGRGELLR